MRNSTTQQILLLTLTLGSLFICKSTQLIKFPLGKFPPITIGAQASDKLYDSVWTTPVALNTTVLTLTPLLYTDNTWISAIDQGNVKTVVKCSHNIECNFTNVTETQHMINYDVNGSVIISNGYEFVLANEFNYTPPAQLNGAFGLGSSNDANSFSFPYTFSNIDHIFSIYISRNFIQTSYLVFGGYESQYMIWNSHFQRIDALDKSNWTFSLSRIDSQSIGATAVFDLNMPYIGIPENQYDSFLSNFTTQYDLNCNMSKVVPTCDCAGFKTLPTLSIVLDQVLFELPPSTYTTSSEVCSLLFTKTSYDNTTKFNVTGTFADIWILGEPFMAYYYMVFYYDEGYVDIAPSREISTNLAAWIVMISVCSFGFIGIVLYRCYQLGPKRRLRDEAGKSQELLMYEAVSLN